MPGDILLPVFFCLNSKFKSMERQKTLNQVLIVSKKTAFRRRIELFIGQIRNNYGFFIKFYRISRIL